MLTTKYKLLRSRKLDLFPSIWNGLSQTGPTTKSIHGGYMTHYWQYQKDRNCKTFHLQSEWKKMSDYFLEKILRDGEYIPRVYKEQKEKGLQLVAFSEEILRRDLSSFSLNDLLSLYRNIQERWTKFDQYNVAPWYVGGDLLNQHLKDVAKTKGLNDDEINILLTLPELSFSSEEELGLAKIVCAIMEDGREFWQERRGVLSQINVLVRKYYWIPFGYDGPLTYDQEHYKQAIADMLEQKSRKIISERVDILSHYKERMTQQQQTILEKHGFEKSLRQLISVMHMLAQMTDERKMYTFPSHVAVDKVLRAIAQKLGMTPFQIKYLQRSELEEYSSDTTSLIRLAEERIHKTIIVHCQRGVAEFLSDEEVSEIEKTIDRGNGEVKIITGIVASKGLHSTVTGKVIILHTPRDIHILRDGNILVTGMTSPEFVPAMRKSGAIITDEGGVTSHAAIVSRELGKPCIIGTKIATQVLQDGDMVEVDTVKGIVKILKKYMNN